MVAYYNENDPYCVAWLRNLIDAKLIAPGYVDDRSILDVRAADLAGYTQCHFFAGLGGWSYALRLAAWPDHREVWTGSCPCQPFSMAGQRRGFADDRHLWPYWHWLIEQRRPPIVLGEQVASATEWLTRVRDDLEAVEYAVGAVPIQAASAGSPQLRDRYWFVAERERERERERVRGEGPTSTFGTAPRMQGAHEERQRVRSDAGPDDVRVRAVAGDDGERQGDKRLQRSRQFGGSSGDPQDHAQHVARSSQGLEECEGFAADARPQCETAQRGGAVGVEHVAIDRWGEGWTEHEFRSRGFAAAVAGFRGSQFVECPDGKWRRLPPPRVRWLGNGIPARISKLRAFGNAIDSRPAQAFIESVMESSA